MFFQIGGKDDLPIWLLVDNFNLTKSIQQEVSSGVYKSSIR